MRIARNLAEESREEGELDTPRRFWRAEEVMLYEGFGEGGTYGEKKASTSVSTGKQSCP